jgi:hypothetical protein
VGYFSRRDLVEVIRGLIANVSVFNDAASALFYWFASEIEAEDLILFRDMYRFMNRHVSCSAAPSIYTSVNLSALRANGWALLKAERSSPKYSEIIGAIRRDDVDFVQYNLSNMEFGFDVSVFEPSWMLHTRKPTAIQLSAYFGSLKCFKFLLLNRANTVFPCDDMSLAQFAIAGGNTEIVRLIEQSECDFAGSLLTASLFHRYSIFEWLTTWVNPTISGDESGNTVPFISVVADNVHALEYCRDHGIDLTATDDSQLNLLHTAVKFGSESSARFLVTETEIDCNARNNSGVSPLHIAAKLGHINIARFMIDSDRVDPNVRTNEGVFLLLI